MKTLIILLATLALAGCVSDKPNPIASSAGSGLIVAGTLSLGPCDASIAPQQTRVSIALQKATRRLADGRLDVATADRVANDGAEILKRLSTVCKHESAGNSDAAAVARDYAARRIPEIESIVRSAK